MSKRRGFISMLTSWLKMFKPFMMDYYDGELNLETEGWWCGRLWSSLIWVCCVRSVALNHTVRSITSVNTYVVFCIAWALFIYKTLTKIVFQTNWRIATCTAVTTPTAHALRITSLLHITLKMTCWCTGELSCLLNAMFGALNCVLWAAMCWSFSNN